MARPSKAQWAVIWVGFVVAALLWTDGLDVEFESDRVAVVVLGAAALLVWQLSEKR